MTMSKVTHNLQVTFPRTLAKRLQIEPGDKVALRLTGDVAKLRATVTKHKAKSKLAAKQLELFDQASQRQRRREKALDPKMIKGTKAGRGWKREQLYTRGGTDRH